MDGRREGGRKERYGALLTVVSEGEVEPWIVVRGVHDARGEKQGTGDARGNFWLSR